MSNVVHAPAVDAKALSLEERLEHANRAFALRKFEESVEHYAIALEIATEQMGEEAPEVADLYFAYGKALLENAISQAGVLGKQDDAETETSGGGKASTSNQAILSFSGDEEDEGGQGTASDSTIDFLGASSDAPLVEDSDVDEEDGDGDEDERVDDNEPEDDFNAAWEVLDLARSIYKKNSDDDDKIKLKLADTYIALGDVSLETEKFAQAIDDYTGGLELKTELLPLSSRELAEAHYKLCIVLDLTGGQLSNAIQHAEGALASVEARISELRQGPSPPITAPILPAKSKGKGKSVIVGHAAQNMTPAQIEAELKDLVEMRDDLALKVDELKTLPDEASAATAPELASKALDQELNGRAPSTEQTKFINDLSNMVRKKAKAPAEVSSVGKRKADEEDVRASTPPEKKLKTDD